MVMEPHSALANGGHCVSMTKAEIAAALLRSIRTYTSGRIEALEFSICVERLGMELTEQSPDDGTKLKDLALRFAVSEIIEGTEARVVMKEIRKLAERLDH